MLWLVSRSSELVVTDAGRRDLIGSTGDITDDDLILRFPNLQLTRDSAAIYRGRLRRRLLLNRCSSCGVWHDPPSPICPACWSREVAAAEVQGTGTVFSVIFLYQGPPTEGVDYAVPYPVVVIELDDQAGLRTTGTVVGSPSAAIRIGCRASLEWIERSGVPMPAWRLKTGGRS